MAPISTAQDRGIADTARSILRIWMRDVEGDALNRVGSAAIRASADAAGQLAGMLQSPSAEHILGEVERWAAEAMAAPIPADLRWWRRARPTAAREPSTDAIASLIARMEGARDDGTRRMLALNTTTARFTQTDQALAEALALIRALGTAIEAAAREVRGDDPARAAMMQRRGGAILLEREQAVLLQSAVHRQAMMTLDLLTANQQTLNAALEQARTATVSALQVTMAARRATGDAAALTGETGTAQAHRLLDTALAQARSALKALPPPPGDRRAPE